MFSSIKDIESYLEQYIPSSALTRFPGEEGVLRTKEFLKLLGSPQNILKVVHVAGTSGKGSTSYMISSFLHSQGFKVGLHLSPHLLDIRERTEINNAFIEEKKYIRYFEEIIPSVEKMKSSAYGTITYFEVMVGFVFYVFAKEKVDYAVVEVGLGGKYDGTNVVDRIDKLAVITKIGFDHTKVLGNTLSKIAYHKAMICKEKGTMISIYQTPTVEKKITSIAQQKKAKLLLIKKNTLRNVSVSDENTQFTFVWNNTIYENFVIGLLGAHQVQNAALALATVHFLAFRDHFTVNTEKIRDIAQALRFKGRMDIVQHKNKKIILDGAHNVQKMKAFLKALATLTPNKKYVFVIAFKKGKEYKKMIRLIIPFAKKIVITHIFSDNPDFFRLSTDPELIQDELLREGFTTSTIVKKITEIPKLINMSEMDVVITGSLYLLGDMYKLLKKAV